MEGCDGCLSVYFNRPLITGSGWVLWYDGFTTAPRAGWEVSLPCTSTTTLVVVYPPLNLTEDLTNKMLVHVNKNNIVEFVFEHSFQWYNFTWYASSFFVLYIMLLQLLVVLIYSKVPVRCTEEWNALIRVLFILTKDVGVISCATGLTCQARNNSAEQQGDPPHSYGPSVSNEQWDVKSQCRTFPDGRSNHYFTLRFAIISNHVVLLLPQEGHAHRLGTSWHVGPHDRPCSPADRSVKSPHFYYYTSSVSVYMACTSF